MQPGKENKVDQTHRHKWEISSVGADHLLPSVPSKFKKIITYTCSCGARRNRAATEEEMLRYNYLDDILSRDTHEVFHAWRKIEEVTADQDLESAADEFCEAHPDMVDIVGCDDSYFASSTILVVHHGTGDNYMGASCIMISQCSGQPPAEWFMYPGHAFQMADVMDRVAGLKRRKALNPDKEAVDTQITKYLRKYHSKPTATDAFRWKSCSKKRWYKTNYSEEAFQSWVAAQKES